MTAPDGSVYFLKEVAFAHKTLPCTGKSTLTDSLVAAAGIIAMDSVSSSSSLSAGQQTVPVNFPS